MRHHFLDSFFKKKANLRREITSQYFNIKYPMEPLWGLNDLMMPHISVESWIEETLKHINLFSRKIRVLILNGEQGYLAMHIAKLGHEVILTDSDQKNLNLVKMIASSEKYGKNIKVIKMLPIEIYDHNFENIDLVVTGMSEILTSTYFGEYEIHRYTEYILNNFDYILSIDRSKQDDTWYAPANTNNFDSYHQIYKVKSKSFRVQRRTPMVSQIFVSKSNPLNFDLFQEYPMRKLSKSRNLANFNIEYFETENKIIKLNKSMKTIVSSHTTEFNNLRKIPNKIIKKIKLPNEVLLQENASGIITIRDKYPGYNLYRAESINNKKCLTNDLVETMVKYAEYGFFHNDLRPWNVIVNECSTHLIDFESLSYEDDDNLKIPQWLSLFAVLSFIAMHSTSHEWNLTEVIEISRRYIEYENPVSQIYYEPAWKLLPRFKNIILNYNFADLDTTINSFTKIIQKNYKQEFQFWENYNESFPK